MPLATPSPYNVFKSLEGDLLGLDNTKANLITPSGLSAPSLGSYAPYLMGQNLQGFRLFPIGKTGLQGADYKITCPYTHITLWDDFEGAGLSAVNWSALTGSNGQASPAIVAGALNGICRLTSGAGSTHTMAVNGEQIVGARNSVVSNGGLRFETRLGNLSAATSQSICFGLIDAVTLTAPFTLATATVTANGTNGACFLQDAGGTNTGLNAVAVNAGGTPQVVSLSSYSINTTSAAFDTYRVEIDAAGNAYFFIDYVLVATILLAVATTANLAPSVGLFSEATSAGQTLDIDYIMLQASRG